MNTKRLITASIFSLISASTALAADVMIPHQPASSTASTIIAPTFSWTGLYLGVQAGGFSSKADMALVGQEKSLPLDKEFSPKLSGFAGGFYAGSNIDLGDNFIFGIDTDLMVSGKKHTKTITIGAADNATVENAVVRSRRSASLQTPQAPQAATSEETQRIASGTAGAGATTGGTLTAVSASEKSAGTRSSQAPAKPVTAIQPSRAGAAQSNQAATTGNSSNVNATQTVAVEVKNPGVSTISSQTPAASPVAQSASSRQTVRLVQLPSSSLGRSNTGGTSVGVVSRSQPVASKSSSPDAGGRTPERSALLSLTRSAIGGQLSGGRASEGTVSEKPVAIKTASSISSTVSGASQPAVKAPTPVQSVSQPSAVERTVPSSSLVLARSGSSNGSETKVSNGTSGAQQAGHHSSSHGSGNANAHGAPYAGGHSSGAHPNGTNPHASRSHGGQNMSGHGAQSTQAVDKNASSVYGIEQIKKMASELGLDQEDAVETLSHTFKQNWGGATRVRIGFAADRFMPYLAGGIAYGQFQDTVSISVKDEDGRVVSSKNLADETKTMIGYTLGGGVDFSLLDNVIVRAEYRYSDFGKKKFAKEKLQVNYKTNDFRVGVAYKF
ncbi:MULTISPECIES: outer membrane beta-barrel protein [unclassified Bartonella]|uniref:outer membrane beta-barrel protein n=1 Tax=unclassified Bartonella TaxID=2645622 RepID=UPI0035CFBD5E